MESSRRYHDFTREYFKSRLNGIAGLKGTLGESKFFVYWMCIVMVFLSILFALVNVPEWLVRAHQRALVRPVERLVNCLLAIKHQ